MCKKLFFLISIILVLGSVDLAYGHARWQPTQRNPENPDDHNDFCDPNNWFDNSKLYGGVTVLSRGPNHPEDPEPSPYMTYTPDPCYTPTDLRGPGEGEGNPPFYWYITGGFMHVSGPWRMCYDDNTTGYTEMTGGELIFDANILCPRANDCTATVKLHGGTIKAADVEFKTGGLFDFAGDGKLILDGDKTADVDDWVHSGYITAYDGDGELVCDYNSDANTTTVTALGVRYKASNPSPGHLAEDVCPVDVNLSWTLGDFAADANGHDIYFGTSPNDVNESADPCVVGYDSNSWKPPSLELGVTYYWRIVEVNDTNEWVGPAWEFTVETGKARDPFPGDGWKGLPSDADLSWTGSCLASAHKVYFGTDFNDVNEGIAYIGEQAAADTNYAPSLETLTTYYWRVDEVGDTTIKGDVWSFKTGLGGVLMYYKFDGSQGADLSSPITDDSGNNIQFIKHIAGAGTLKYAGANPAYNTSGTSADFDPCAGFYRLDTGEGDILHLDGYQYTIEMWVKVEAPPDGGDAVLIGKGPWRVMINDVRWGDDPWDNELRWFHNGDATDEEGVVEDDEWMHIAAVFDRTLAEDGESQRLYIDGEEISDGGHPNFNPADVNAAGIGCRTADGIAFHNFFDGRIDELRILDVALRPNQFLNPLATNPSPSDGQGGIDPNDPNVLSWTPWAPLGLTVQHDVYFGTDYPSVRDAGVGDDPNGVYRGRFDTNSWPTDGNTLELELKTTYYWRVDEVYGTITKGEIWSFKTMYEIVDANLLLWYPFDEGMGEWVYDNSGYENHSYDSSINPDNWDADGKLDGCLHF